MFDHAVGVDDVKLILLVHIHVECIALDTGQTCLQVALLWLMKIQEGHILFESGTYPGLACTSNIEDPGALLYR